MAELLRIEDLKVEVDGKEILRGLDLNINEGEVHAIMGPNGSGKSTLANAIMGNELYSYRSGRILFMGQDITDMPTEQRARLGIFMGFQYPVELPGIKMASLLNRAIGVQKDRLNYKNIRESISTMESFAGKVNLGTNLLRRSLNEGFSGGEKKKAEIVQLGVLKPHFAILDEIDSGLDIDALKSVSSVIKELLDGERGFLIITHYHRILDYIKPDYVHVMIDGRVVHTGGLEVIDTIEDRGFEAFQG